MENVTPTHTVSYLYKDACVVPIPGENEFDIIPFDPDLWGDGSPIAGENEFNILPFGNEEETEDEAEAETDAEEEDEPQKWGDLLTSYDGKAITYDEIGNPLTWGNRSFTWQHGRQLATLTENGTTWTYTYGADGLRTGRTNGTTTYSYVYNGSQLVQMTVGEDTLRFAYDAVGVPLSVNYNGTIYYYVTNIQSDVVAIVNASGVEQVRYTYGAWGQLLSTTGTLATTLGAHNPLRYRGYVYDTETGLYYLQSRYYDPALGRFINADGLVSTVQGFIGNNMFAYCANNPVNFFDPEGQSSLWVIVGIVVGCVMLLSGCERQKVEHEPYLSADDAARAFAEEYYSQSSYVRHEFAALIYSRTVDGLTTYNYTAPEYGTAHNSHPGWNKPKRTKIVAYIHTHPNENEFSGRDISFANKYDINAYVIGPNLELQRYNYLRDYTISLGQISPRPLLSSEKEKLISQFQASWDEHIAGGHGCACHTLSWPNS